MLAPPDRVSQSADVATSSLLKVASHRSMPAGYQGDLTSLMNWRAIVKSGVRRVIHAAALLSSMHSMPSLSLMPLMTLGR